MGTTILSLKANVQAIPSDAALSVSANLHIFWGTESARPGEQISLQGYFPANAQVGIALADSPNYSLAPIVSQSANYIKATIPASMPVGVYRIFIKDGSTKSAPHYINKVQGWGFDTSHVYAGAKVQLCGLNLVLPGKTPTIRFVSQANGASLNATYNPQGSNKYRLNFIAPLGLVNGVTYNVHVSNGYGNTAAESLVLDTLFTIAAQKDVFGIGLAWHANFTSSFYNNVYNVKTDSRLASKAVGDNVANDLPAINAAVSAADAAGGGVVYLPAGNYKLEGSGAYGFTLRNKVVIRGAGKALTRLYYGTGTSIDKFIGTYEHSINGVMDLSLINLNTTGGFTSGLMQKSNFTFFKNVYWDMKKGDWLEIIDQKNILFDNCQIEHDAAVSVHGPIGLITAEHITLKNNKFTFVTGPYLNTFKYLFAENNIFVRDWNRPKSSWNNILHLFVNEFGTDSYVANNKFLLEGTIAREADGKPTMNDGESIISENGGAYSPDMDYGTVTGATATTLTAAAKAWATTFQKAPEVAIVKGKGTGQVRKITSRTATVLTISEPWTIIPDTTSRFQICNFGLDRVAYPRNYFENQQRGMTLYMNPMRRVYCEDNVFINSGGISLTPTQVNNTMIPFYNVDIINNYADSSSDPYNGVSMGVHAVQHLEAVPLGTVAINLAIRGNTIIGAAPNKNMVEDDSFPTGYHAYIQFHNGGTNYNDDNTEVILGTIIENNIARDVEKVVTLSTGSYHTSISTAKQLNSPALVDDIIMTGTQKGSVSTVTS